MASPRADAYVAGSGATVRGGRGSGHKLTITGGSSSGVAGVIAPFFTVGYTGTLTGSVVVSMSDGASGSFWPLNYAADKSVTISPANPTAVFFYCPVGAGAKSITTTNNSGLVNANARTFTASTYTAPSATPFRLTRGGATIGSYATLQRCKDIGGWQSGDVIKATGGKYVVYDVTDPGNTGLVDNTGGVQMGVGINTLTVEWETPGVPMELDWSRFFMVGMWTGGQPRLLTMGSACRNLTIRGIHFRGARPPRGASWYGAATWTQLGGTQDGATFTAEYCKFSELPDGIKSQDARYDLSSYVRYCVFEDNSDGRGLDHDIYTGHGALTHVEGCTFRKTAKNPYPQNGMGHFIKSRCRQTVVRGNLLDGVMSPGYVGGVAQAINTPNGGVVEITGNVINYYGSQTTSSNGNPLRFGDDQHTQTVDTNLDPSLLTHSLLFAQNTVRQYLGRAPDGAEPSVISIYPTGVATTLLSGPLVQIPMTATVRNNLVAYDTPGTKLTSFLANYPNNTVVNVSTLSDIGMYAGAIVAGSPAINDAPLEWVGEFAIPAARTDTNRGGHADNLPAWVPSTAWQWTDIPGTRWYDSVNDAGTGSSGAPAVTNVDPGPTKSYGATWEFSGPTYSKKNHEIWHMGGGHAGTTINMVTRYNLHQDVPTVTMVSAPTPEQYRRDWHLGASYAQALVTPPAPYYPVDGKLYTSHTYANLQYLDATDEFVSFPAGATLTSSDGGATLGGGPYGWMDVAALPRNGTTWRAKGSYANIPTLQDSAYVTYCAKLTTAAGDKTYYWPDGYAPRYFTYATNTYTTIGGTASGTAVGKGAFNATETKTLHVNGSSAGWVVYSYDLATGIRSTVNVTGASLPVGLSCWGVHWAPAANAYVVVFITSTAVNGAGGGTITSMPVYKLTMTDDTNAVATEVTMTGAAPTVCNSITGAFFDPIYNCLIVVTSPAQAVKAIKVN